MNFPPLWIAWIQKCLSTPTFLVMVKGCPTGYFAGNKRIRQGDHLSPYIFALAMEFWSIQMDVSVALESIQLIKKGMRSYVSHLLYADDMLVFLRANKKKKLYWI